MKHYLAQNLSVHIHMIMSHTHDIYIYIYIYICIYIIKHYNKELHAPKKKTTYKNHVHIMAHKACLVILFFSVCVY